PHVHDHKVGARLLDLVDDLDPGRGLRDAVALVREKLAEKRADGRVVIRDEDGFLCHQTYAFGAKAASRMALIVSLPTAPASFCPNCVHVKSPDLRRSAAFPRRGYAVCLRSATLVPASAM